MREYRRPAGVLHAGGIGRAILGGWTRGCRNLLRSEAGRLSMSSIHVHTRKRSNSRRTVFTQSAPRLRCDNGTTTIERPTCPPLNIRSSIRCVGNVELDGSDTVPILKHQQRTGRQNERLTRNLRWHHVNRVHSELQDKSGRRRALVEQGTRY